MKLTKTEKGYFYEKYCLNCNKKFLGNVKSKFCSLDCSVKYRNKSYNLVCRSCKKAFTGHNPRQFYCENCKNKLTTCICKKCGKEFKVNKPSERRKFCSKHCERKHIFNESIFETIDTFEKAYWLGFLMGDGHIRYDKQRSIRELILGLSEKDYNHIIKFTEFLSFSSDNIPLKYDKKRKAYILRVASKKLISDLEKIGFPIFNKTENAYVPDFDNYNLRHAFLLGLFDADGSVFLHKKTLYISICGTLDVCKSFGNFMDIDLSFIKKIPNTKIYELKVGKQKLSYVLSFHKKLYENAPIYLERKKYVFDTFIKQKFS